MPSTGSKFQKFITSARDWESIQQHRRLDREPREHRAQPSPPCGCSAAPGAIEPSVTSTSGGPLAADVGIELERAHDHRRRQRAAAAVADDDDLVGIVGAHRRDERCAQASIGASKQVGSPRANAQR